MTHEDVMQMLAETEIPFAYDHFAEGESPDPPFICFLFPGSENFAADNVVYMEFSNLNEGVATEQVTDNGRSCDEIRERLNFIKRFI